jgi:threonine dehydratase
VITFAGRGSGSADQENCGREGLTIIPPVQPIRTSSPARAGGEGAHRGDRSLDYLLVPVGGGGLISGCASRRSISRRNAG